MPVYLHLANLVFDKRIITDKYDGGCTQFKIDFEIEKSNVNQEDDELFLVAKMNMDEFDFSTLIKKGLSYNNNFSNDFVAISRYGGAHWKTEWLKCNAIFAWHSCCSQSQKDRAVEIGEELTMDKIQELMEEGVNVFETIKTANFPN
jgi:hypothetical protein